MTGLYTYQFWIQREDKLLSIEAFKKRLEYMDKETKNLTEWNKKLTTDIEQMTADNAKLEEQKVGLAVTDIKIKTDLLALQEQDKKLTRDLQTWKTYIEDKIFG